MGVSGDTERELPTSVRDFAESLRRFSDPLWKSCGFLRFRDLYYDPSGHRSKFYATAAAPRPQPPLDRPRIKVRLLLDLATRYGRSTQRPSGAILLMRLA